MPIRPPKLDDRKYEDIVREARALIPQYCPEWTNLGDADPGMTLVQLFAWMTEMMLYRINRVPDKTYVHFLNFIGEQRKQALPAVVPLTFYLRQEDKESAELPAFTRCSTRQREGADALHFLTTDQITTHNSAVDRMVVVHAGSKPTVREIAFEEHSDCRQALLFGGGRGVNLFEMDPVEHGPRAYTPYQFLYVSHDDFRLMDFKAQPGSKIGRIRMRASSQENLPVGSLFEWEFFNGDQSDSWTAVKIEEEEQAILGLPETTLDGHLPGLVPLEFFGESADPIDLPEVFEQEHHWIRGRVNYEAWLVERMNSDLTITWRDDRGGEERLITNWDVRATGRNLEYFIQDMPPIRGGWTVRFTMVDRSMPAGRNAYFPTYRWSYRRGERWDEIPRDRVRVQGTTIVLTGPLSDMATDGFNLRAERMEAVSIEAFVPRLELELTWLRPIELSMAAGPEDNAAVQLDRFLLPALPFQPAPTLPPLLGMKFFIGTDLLENRSRKTVLLEIEVGFEMDSQPIIEPKESYHLQLAYRAHDTWRVVHTDDDRFSEFTFADLDPEGALVAARRKIRILLDPETQLDGLQRADIGGQDTCWLRFELSRGALTFQKDKKSPPKPISIRVFSVDFSVADRLGQTIYEQPMPGLKTATVEFREENRRLTRVRSRAMGQITESRPFDSFIDLADDEDADDHHAVYMRFDRPLPLGARHVLNFRCRGESYLPEGFSVQWEALESAGHERLQWRRLVSSDDGSGAYQLNRSGELEFPYPEAVEPAAPGFWMRGLFRVPKGEDFPSFPPVSHLLLNSVEGVNLHAFRIEKFSGQGVPHQSIQLRRFPLYLHADESEASFFPNPDRFADIRVFVVEDDGERREWRRAPGNSILTASKDDRVFIVDTVEGTLTFGNGIRGRLLPVGSFNITVEVYHAVPGESGNIGPGEVALVEGFADLCGVQNLLPATGGRNAESIDEIMRRAPSVLTSRDRAVTRRDFEIIAGEASGEVARAACDGKMSDDGVVEIIILPQRREGEHTPDPFLSAGLKEHVQTHLGKRCLVNVAPQVRLATFKEVDVSVNLRLKPNANFIVLREKASQWIKTFLDPYDGGLEGLGWPFGGTLFAQDFGRMVRDLTDVRHVIEVSLYEVQPGMDAEFAGWEKGQGTKVLVLDQEDLFSVRHVRVTSSEDES
jgi:hypothetical protein